MDNPASTTNPNTKVFPSVDSRHTPLLLLYFSCYCKWCKQRGGAGRGGADLTSSPNFVKLRLCNITDKPHTGCSPCFSSLQIKALLCNPRVRQYAVIQRWLARGTGALYGPVCDFLPPRQFPRVSSCISVLWKAKLYTSRLLRSVTRLGGSRTW